VEVIWKSSRAMKAGHAFLVAGLSLLSISIPELVINKIASLPVFLNGNEAVSSVASFSEIVGAILCGVSICFYIFAVYMDERRVSREKLVYDKQVTKVLDINSSEVYIYLGSINEVSEAEVVVTSEDTDLNLGSMSGTSVSGRLRRMAATVSSSGEVSADNLFMEVSRWKSGLGKLSDFSLGTSVVIDGLAELLKWNVKKVILAVSIRKNDDQTSFIDRAAISRIVLNSFDECLRCGHKSIFVPVFGLGSGNVGRLQATGATLSAVYDVLRKRKYDLKVYLGVYRTGDFVALSVAAAKCSLKK